MTDLTIHSPLAETLVAIAQREKRPVEAVLATMVEQYQAHTDTAAPRHNVVVAEVPADVQDEDAYRAAVQATRPTLYRMARDYWEKVGDQTKRALTDEQLDEQFWLIDPNGVPRLKGEQGTIDLPSDPLDAIAGLIEDAPPDLSLSVRTTIAAHYRARDDDDRTP